MMKRDMVKRDVMGRDEIQRGGQKLVNLSILEPLLVAVWVPIEICLRGRRP